MVPYPAISAYNVPGWSILRDVCTMFRLLAGCAVEARTFCSKARGLLDVAEKLIFGEQDW